MNNAFEGFQFAGKDNMDLMMKSFGSFGKGMQAIAAEYADFSKKSFEESSAAFEKMVAAKSPDKALATQGEFVKESYAGLVSEMNKINEMYADLARETYKSFEGTVGKAAK